MVLVTHGPPIFGNGCESNDAGVVRRECYKHTVVVEVCECLDPVVGEKRIYKLVWQLSGQSFAKLSLET